MVFSALFFAQNFSPPTYLPPPNYLTSFCVCSIAKTWEGLRTLELRGVWGLGAKCNRFKQGKMQELEGVTLRKTQEFEKMTQGKMRELETEFLPFIFFVVVLLRKKQRQ